MRFSTYVLYTIHEKKDGFICKRRFNDFFNFRELLKVRYPSTLIPTLPPKSLTGKLLDNQEFYVSRRIQLDLFLRDLVELSEIMDSEELKHFLLDEEYVFG